DGTPAQVAAVLPAVVKDNELRTYVVCTNLGATPVDLGLEVFDQNGVRGNTIAAGDGALLHAASGGTVTFSTRAAGLLHEEEVIAGGPPVTVLGQGSGRVLATGLQVACAAYAVDRFHQIRDPQRSAERPPTLTVLPVRPACTPPACADGDPCTLDACDPAGVCTHTIAPDGTLCNDGNACTTGETCVADQCVGSAVSCDDGDPCPTDPCAPASGCLHAPVHGCPPTATSPTPPPSMTTTTSPLPTTTPSTMVDVATTSTTAETSTTTTSSTTATSALP